MDLCPERFEAISCLSCCCLLVVMRSYLWVVGFSWVFMFCHSLPSVAGVLPHMLCSLWLAGVVGVLALGFCFMETGEPQWCVGFHWRGSSGVHAISWHALLGDGARSVCAGGERLVAPSAGRFVYFSARSARQDRLTRHRLTRRINRPHRHHHHHHRTPFLLSVPSLPPSLPTPVSCTFGSFRPFLDFEKCANLAFLRLMVFVSFSISLFVRERCFVFCFCVCVCGVCFSRVFLLFHFVFLCLSVLVFVGLESRMWASFRVLNLQAQ